MVRRLICALLFLVLVSQAILPVHGSGETLIDYGAIAVGNDGIVSPEGWLSEPVTAIIGYLRDGQPVIGVLAPFLAIVVLGFVLVARREHRKGRRQPLLFWLATIAGLAYLGGAAVTFVQLFRVFSLPGQHPVDLLQLVSAIAGIVLGTLAMRTARSPSSGSVHNRMILVATGIIGLVSWCGLIVGPVLLFCAAALPVRIKIPSWPVVLQK